MGKQLVLVGTDHAHLAALLKLQRCGRWVQQILSVGPYPHYTCSGMGPRLLPGIYTLGQDRIHNQRLFDLRGAR